MKKWLAILLCTMALSATAFAAAEQIQSTIPLDGAQLILDAEVWNAKEQASVYPCSAHEWNQTRMAEVLFGSRAYQKGEALGDMHRTYPKYAAEDGFELVFMPTNVVYSNLETALLYGIAQNFALNGERVLHGASLESAGDSGFERFTSADVKSMVAALAQDLSLPMYMDMMECIPLPAALFRQVFDYYDEKYEDFVMPTYEVADCYWVSVPMQMDGIPQLLESFDMQSTEKSIESANANILLSRDEILYATFQTWYEPTSAVEPRPLITPEEAVQKLAEALSMLILERDVVIDRISLEYMMVESRSGMTLTPVWVFYTAPVYIAEADMYANVSNYYIHAVTGEYIY